MQGEILHMTKEIGVKMELEKLIKRRDKINGHNEELNKQAQQVFARNKELQEIYVKISDQYKINAGALGEINRQIAELEKEQAPKEEVKTEEKVDKKSKK